MRQKKDGNSFLKRAENFLDIPKGILSDMPSIELCGSSLCDINNFKGLLDFSPESVRVNTSGGTVRLSGSGLEITAVTDENVTVRGKIEKLEFE